MSLGHCVPLRAPGGFRAVPLTRWGRAAAGAGGPGCPVQMGEGLPAGGLLKEGPGPAGASRGLEGGPEGRMEHLPGRGFTQRARAEVQVEEESALQRIWTVVGREPLQALEQGGLWNEHVFLVVGLQYPRLTGGAHSLQVDFFAFRMSFFLSSSHLLSLSPPTSLPFHQCLLRTYCASGSVGVARAQHEHTGQVCSWELGTQAMTGTRDGVEKRVRGVEKRVRGVPAGRGRAWRPSLHGAGGISLGCGSHSSPRMCRSGTRKPLPLLGKGQRSPQGQL